MRNTNDASTIYKFFVIVLLTAFSRNTFFTCYRVAVSYWDSKCVATNSAYNNGT